MTKTIIIVANNFPSQFKTALNVACLKNWNVFGVCHQEFLVDQYAPTSNIKLLKDIPFDAVQSETNHIHFTNALLLIKDLNIRPDLILMHIGFGIERSCRHLFPDTPIVGYCEWYFGENTLGDRGRRVTDVVKNYGIRKQLDECDFLISPTRIQRVQYPLSYQRRIAILHEGIDTVYWRPSGGLNIERAPATVTYVSRGLEPTRKFMEFIHGLKLVLDERPDVRVKIIGKDKVFYSDHKESFMELAKRYLTEPVVAQDSLKTLPALDNTLLSRVEWLGDVPRDTVLATLQGSNVHVYFTDVFVPSWSMLEAMSCGCLMVCSDNVACQEFIVDGVHGILVDHADPVAVKNAILKGLDLSPADRDRMKNNARAGIVDQFNTAKSAQQWLDTMTAIM